MLTCQAGEDANQATYFDVLWRHNGTIVSNSILNGIMTTYNHYLQVDPVTSIYSGTYSCELNGDAAVRANLSITVKPGMISVLIHFEVCSLLPKL